MAYRRIVVMANGALHGPQFIRDQLKEDDYIICADGGRCMR